MERGSFEALCISHRESLEQIRSMAHQIHESVNQFYDGDKPYGYHLDMVAKEVYAYGHLVLVGEADLLPLFMGAWFHDSIEDARLSYNDVKKIALKLGLTEEQAFMASEIVYALTNEKGRNRAERANEKYFEGIRETPYAPFVKLADRLANTSYAFSKGTADSLRMSKVYREELPGFLEALKVEGSDVRFSLPEAMVKDLWDIIPQCGSENYV
jgi:(p)ppGpp synthase/HD superfamily hydrolase